MADKKITELNQITTIDPTDIFPVVDNPSGSPETKKSTFQQLADWLASLSQTLANKTLISSTLQANNNVAVVSQKDNTGTERNILKLNSSNDLEIGGAGISSYKLNNSIIKPSSDSTSAIKITKANGTTTILNINSTNNFVGIGTDNPVRKLHIYDTDSNGGLRLEGGSDGPNIEWRTGTTRHWNIDQEGTNPNLRFFTENSSDGEGAVRMLITESGNVGIGTDNPAYRLDVNGQCHASSFPTSSDKRFKENVKEINNALEKVKKLRGVYFNWNKFYRETLEVDETEDTEIGVIAQEVKKVIPEVVTTFKREVGGKKKKYYSVEYARLSALLINAIKELAEKVENLEKKYGEINNSRA